MSSLAVGAFFVLFIEGVSSADRIGKPPGADFSQGRLRGALSGSIAPATSAGAQHSVAGSHAPKFEPMCLCWRWIEVTDCDDDEGRRYGGDDEKTNSLGHTESRQVRTSDVLF